MNNKNIIIICALIAVLLVVIGFIKVSLTSGYRISITNNTDKTVGTLELKYKTGNVMQTITQIEAKKSWRGAIATDSIQGENAIILTYKDKNGKSYEETVVGYLEKGFRGKANVVINKIDENGKLEMVVK